MSEEHIMMDVLSTEKCITANTVMAMNEASCDAVYKTYKDIFDKVTKETKEIFTICFNNNWYKLEEAQTTKVEQEVTKLCTELNKEG